MAVWPLPVDEAGRRVTPINMPDDPKTSSKSNKATTGSKTSSNPEHEKTITDKPISSVE